MFCILIRSLFHLQITNMTVSYTHLNPQSGKVMRIPASKAPKFKAGKALKDTINA